MLIVLIVEKGIYVAINKIPIRRNIALSKTHKVKSSRFLICLFFLYEQNKYLYFTTFYSIISITIMLSFMIITSLLPIVDLCFWNY